MCTKPSGFSYSKGLKQHVCVQPDPSPAPKTPHRPLPAFGDTCASPQQRFYALQKGVKGFLEGCKAPKPRQRWSRGVLGWLMVCDPHGTRVMPVYEIPTHWFELSVWCDHIPVALLLNERKKGEKENMICDEIKRERKKGKKKKEKAPALI